MSNTRELLRIEEGTVEDKWIDRVEEEVLYLAPNLRHTPLLLASTVKDVLRTLRFDDTGFPELMLGVARDISAVSSRIRRNRINSHGEAFAYLTAVVGDWELMTEASKRPLQSVCAVIAQLDAEVSAAQKEELNALIKKMDLMNE